MDSTMTDLQETTDSITKANKTDKYRSTSKDFTTTRKRRNGKTNRTPPMRATPLNGKTKRSTRRLSMLLPRKQQRQLKPLRSRTSMLQTRPRAESSPNLPPSDLPTKLPKSG